MFPLTLKYSQYLLQIAPSTYPCLINYFAQDLTDLITVFYLSKVIGFGLRPGFANETITLFMNHKNKTNLTFKTYAYVAVFSAKY